MQKHITHPHTLKAAWHAAFTLVELSIVIVIIGLIVGGIVGGQSLIKSTQRKAIISEYNQYQTAFNTFRDKYDAWPGDMINAASYWPGVNNGNGDSLYINYNEGYYAWNHLSKAGIIQGAYLGAGYAGDGIIDPGIDTPRSRFPGGAFVAFSWSLADHGVSADTIRTNRLYFGKNMGGSGGGDWTPLLTCNELSEIDTKIDDTNPSKGKVRDYAMCGLGTNTYVRSDTQPTWATFLLAR